VLAAFLWLVILFFIVQPFPDVSLWYLHVFSLWISAPLFYASYFVRKKKREARALMLSEHSELKPYATSTLLLLFVSAVISVICGAVLTIWFSTLNVVEWVAMFLSIPIAQWSINICSRYRTEVREEYQSYIITHYGVMLSVAILSVILLCISFFGIQITPAKEGLDSSFVVLDPSQSDSFLVQISYFTFSTISDLHDLVVMDAAGNLGLSLFISVLIAISAVSTFFMAARFFWVVDVSSFNSQGNTKRYFIVSMLAVLFLMVIYLPMMVQVEQATRENSERIVSVAGGVTKAISNVEKMGKDYFSPGTIDSIEKIRMKFANLRLAKFQSLEDGVIKQVKGVHSLMRLNVDSYLDHYYSIAEDYKRLGNLAQGQLEEYLINDMTSHLLKNVPESNIQAMLGQYDVEVDKLKTEYKSEVEKIFSQNKLVLDNTDAVLVVKSSQDDGLELSRVEQFDTFKKRLSASVGGGALLGVIAGTLSKKLAAKGVGKIAAKGIAMGVSKLLAKLGVSAAAGVTSGTTAGAYAGSLGGPPGAVVGSIVGAVVGVVSTVAFDFISMALDEVISRDEFKAQIMQSIDESESTLLAKLKPS
jgi:hypothetical protein